MDKKSIFNLIVEANKKYREGNPIMDDAEFDKLENELKLIDPDNEWFKRGVNDETPKDRKYEIPFPMMSLNKVKKISDVYSWMNSFPDGCRFVVTPKFDGLSVGMSNDKAWTRGDGIIGQLCTGHVDCISDRPKNIDGNINVRGEIVFKFSNWNKFKEKHPDVKSPRNSATGLINGDFSDDKIDDYNLLSVIPYDVIGLKINKSEQLSMIGDCPYVMIERDISEFDLNALFFKWSKDYPIDGLVIDVEDFEHRNGTEANGNPKYSIAYKHPSFSESGVSFISDIEMNINRDGVITPVIRIEPSLNISGAEISKVNGINMGYVEDWKMYKGQEVTIIRSGEVIPRIIAVGGVKIPFREEFDKNSEYLSAYKNALEKRNSCSVEDTDLLDNGLRRLEVCPFCGERLKKEGINYVCKNMKCSGVSLQRIVKFFEIIGLEGFGEAKLKQLYDEKMIGSFDFDAFFLEKSEFEGLDGWGDKSVDDFLSKLKKISDGGASMAKFMHATGYFSDLGEKTIQKILDTIDYEDLTKKNLIMGVDGIQEITANKFIEGIGYFDGMYDVISKIFKFKYYRTPISSSESGPLGGVVVCATGFRDKMLFKKITDLGGTVLDNFNKSVTVLITKEPNSTSSKVKKAEKMGIEVIDKEAFIEKYMSYQDDVTKNFLNLK